MSKRDWLVAGGILAALILIAVIARAGQNTEPDLAQRGPDVPKSMPERTSTPSGQPPPVPHKVGEPHGLGVTNQMIVDALVPVGFAFEEQFNEVVQRPAVRGYASLGPSFKVYAVGSPRGVIEFTLETYWSLEAQPPLALILSVVNLVTPSWAGAEEWVREQVEALGGQEDTRREISTGNYAVRVFAFKVGDDPGIQVSVSPRFASCADALAAQDWTTGGSVGNERGYAQWRVPSEPDSDGDRTVCESIQQ